MICPACGHDNVKIEDAAAHLHTAAQALGSLGGRTTGKTKARKVDYAAMARLSHQKRRENKAKKHG